MPRRKAAFYGLVQALDVGGLRFDEAKKWGTAQEIIWRHPAGHSLRRTSGGIAEPPSCTFPKASASDL